MENKSEELLDDDYRELALDTLPINILFFLKKVDDEAIIESFLNCISYILEKQEESKSRLVHTIYAERWVI